LLLAALAVGAVFAVGHFCCRRRHVGEKKIPWKKMILLLVFACYLMMVFFATTFRTSGIYRQVNLHLFRAWREA
jgi:hypothetical protein